MAPSAKLHLNALMMQCKTLWPIRWSKCLYTVVSLCFVSFAQWNQTGFAPKACYKTRFKDMKRIWLRNRALYIPPLVLRQLTILPKHGVQIWLYIYPWNYYDILRGENSLSSVITYKHNAEFNILPRRRSVVSRSKHNKNLLNPIRLITIVTMITAHG